MMRDARPYRKRTRSIGYGGYRTPAAAAPYKKRTYVRKSYIPRGIPMGELKGVDTKNSGSRIIDTTNTNAQILVPNLPRTGSGSYNRVGRKAKLSSLRIKFNIDFSFQANATTGVLEGNYVRCAVVWDKQPSGTIPSFDTIFGVTVQDGTESSTLLAPLKYDNTARFSVLRDDLIMCNPEAYNGAAGTGPFLTYRKIHEQFIALKGKTTVFSGDSAPMTIADISSGALYVILRSQVNITGENEANLGDDSFMRLRFTDY